MTENKDEIFFAGIPKCLKISQKKEKYLMILKR